MKIDIKDFFNNELVNYASYDNLRKIASCIDGLKNASRKVMYTIHEKKIREKVKVSQLSSKCAEYSDYLHGDTLWNVIVTLGRDYPGTNNIPLIKKFGNFGTRCINESSAPRYIFAHGSDEFFDIFKYEDDPILEQQFFEGSRIEPRFYVPSLPMILVNGAEGVSSGFAQKILPRNPENLKKYIRQKIKGITPSQSLLNPWFRGFRGEIFRDAEVDGKWYIKGKIEHISYTEYRITEIPLNYDLKSYIKTLNDLVDNGTITKWANRSDGENCMQFSVWIPRSQDCDDNGLCFLLKLIKPITENYTCIDENNKIIEFKSARDIIDHYIEVKLKFLAKRKEWTINSNKSEISILESKIKFLTMYIESKIKICRVPTEKIIKQLEDLSFQKVDGSYNYLLSMPISSLTEDRLNALISDCNKLIDKNKELASTTPQDMWICEL